MTMTRLTILAGAALVAFGLSCGVQAAAQPPRIDPACMKDVPWEVDASGPIRIWGCRPAARVPAADAQGWVQFDRPKAKDGTDAGWIRARMVKTGPAGVVTFEVQDNGGGSGVFPYRVTGKPGPDGVLAKAGLKVDSLPAN